MRTKTYIIDNQNSTETLIKNYGELWSYIDNLPIKEFYNLIVKTNDKVLCEINTKEDLYNFITKTSLSLWPEE